MRKTSKRLAFSTLAALAALLVVGVASASADGGRGKLGGGASVSKLVTAAATQLNVSRSTLTTAIHNSADTHIATAKTNGDITSSQADDLTASADDNLDLAYRLSDTATVASNLSITTDALNAGFAAARKALALAQVAAAQTAGNITADQATALTTKINAKTFPGYKGGLGGGLGQGLGFGRLHGGGGGDDSSSDDNGGQSGKLSVGSGTAAIGGLGHGARHGHRR